MPKTEHTTANRATADQKQKAMEIKISRLIDSIVTTRDILMTDPTPTKSTYEAIDELEKAMWRYSNAQD